MVALGEVASLQTTAFATLESAFREFGRKTGGNLALELRLRDHLATSGFEDRFVAKGRFERRMADMPVKTLTYADAGLFGGAVAFLHEHSND